MSTPRPNERVVAVIVIAAGLVLPFLTATAKDRPAIPVDRRAHDSISGDLAGALGAVATQMHVPLIAELALPLPQGFNIPAGKHGVDEFLNLLLKTSPGYSWRWHGRVVHFYNLRLIEASANVFNIKLESFTLPSDVAELHGTLRRSLWECSIPRSERLPCPYVLGGLIEGNYPIELQPLRLTPRSVPSTLARQVMLEAADASGEFYSILVFPRAAAGTPEDAEYAFYHWAWQRLSDQSKAFPTPFPSHYERILQMSSDELFRNLITHTAKHRQESPNPGATYVELWITVDKFGSVKLVSAGKGPTQAVQQATAAVRSWRFKPYYMNELPIGVKSEITVEVAKGGAVVPITPNSCGS